MDLEDFSLLGLETSTTKYWVLSLDTFCHADYKNISYTIKVFNFRFEEPIALNRVDLGFLEIYNVLKILNLILEDFRLIGLQTFGPQVPKSLRFF